MNIILYLLQIIQDLYRQNIWLILFICKYIPLRQWAFVDSNSPKYQKFKTDSLPRIEFHHSDLDRQFLIPYYKYKYHKKIKPISRRRECDIPQDCRCPACAAPTVATPLPTKKTVSTSSSINVSIPDALTIFAILEKWIRSI